MRLLLLTLMFCGGIAVAVQPSINGRLAQKTGILESSCISFFIGTLALLVAALLIGQGALTSASRATCGAGAVYGRLLAAPSSWCPAWDPGGHDGRDRRPAHDGDRPGPLRPVPAAADPLRRLAGEWGGPACGGGGMSCGGSRLRTTLPPLGSLGETGNFAAR